MNTTFPQNLNFSIPVMLTISKTAVYFNLPEHMVRQTVKRNQNLCRYSGNRAYVNIERFCEYLQCTVA